MCLTRMFADLKATGIVARSNSNIKVKSMSLWIGAGGVDKIPYVNIRWDV